MLLLETKINELFLFDKMQNSKLFL